MFATKLTTVLALFSVAAQVAVAAPPACLLAAVNTADDPADMAAVCKNGDVKSYLSSKCGDNADAAMEAFQSACKDAGVEVSTSTSSSASHSKSSDSSHSATGYPSSTKSSSAEESSASATGTMTKSLSSGSSMSMAPYPMGTGAGSSGFSTATSNSTGYAAPSGSSGSSPAPTESGPASSTGGAERLGMDLVGLAAVGVFGAMLAL